MKSKNNSLIDKQTAEKFAKYMKKYSEMYQDLAKIIQQNLPKKSHKKPLIVDLGVGPGLLPIEIKKILPNAKIIGLDPSINMVKLSQNKGFTLALSTAEKLPIKNESTDLVVSRFSLCYWNTADKGLSEIYRILKPEGKIILETLNKDFSKIKLLLIKLHMYLNLAGGSVVRYHIDSYNHAFSQENVEKMLKSVGFKNIKKEGDSKEWKTVFIAEKK